MTEQMVSMKFLRSQAKRALRQLEAYKQRVQWLQRVARPGEGFQVGWYRGVIDALSWAGGRPNE